MCYENNRLIEHTQEEIDTMLVEIILSSSFEMNRSLITDFSR